MKDSTKKIIITVINIVMFIGNAVIAYLQPSAPVQAATAVSMVTTAICAIAWGLLMSNIIQDINNDGKIDWRDWVVFGITTIGNIIFTIVNVIH